MVQISQNVIEISTPTLSNEVVNKGYVDGYIENSKFTLNSVKTSGISTDRGLASLGSGLLAVSVANVSVLRSTPAYILAGSIRLDCHTFAGLGGGVFHWDSSSIVADDGGMNFAVSGVSTGRWRRLNRENHVKLIDFGGDPTGATTSDGAFTAAYNFIRTGVEQKSIDFGDGHYKFANSISITTSNIVLLGRDRSTVLEFTGGGNGFVISTSLYGFRLRGFHITCGSVVSGNMIDLSTGQACLLGYDIDVTLGGKWNKVIGGGGSNALLRGAFQWGRMRLIQLSPSNAPSNGIYLQGAYFNSCWTYVDFYGIAGDAIHIEGMTDYVYGGWAVFEGSVQDCGRQLYLTDAGSYRFNNFYSENQPLLDHIENCRWLDFKNYSTTGLDLRSSTECDCRYMIGMVREDGYCFGNLTDNLLQGRPGIGDALERVNMSAISEGGPFILELAGGAAGGFSHIDPGNLALGGDMSRWVSGAANQLWCAPGGSYSAVKCGVGCIDTESTSFTKNCALLSVNPLTPTQPWIVILSMIPAGVLDASFTNVPVFISFKAKGFSGDMPGAAIAPIGIIGVEHKSYGCGISCENGFTHFVMAKRLTTEMISSGVQFNLSGLNTETYYISEVTLSIGNGAPRTFIRAVESPFYSNGCIDDSGHIVWYGTSSDTIDPILGRSVQNGDLVVIQDPAIEVTSGGQGFRTISYSRVAGVWESNQLLTGLVGV